MVDGAWFWGLEGFGGDYKGGCKVCGFLRVESKNP